MFSPQSQSFYNIQILDLRKKKQKTKHHSDALISLSKNSKNLFKSDF